MPTSEVIKLKKSRLSFPNLFKAKSFEEGQDPRFEATFLLDPSNKSHAKIIKTIKSEAARIAKEKWGDKIPKHKKCFGLTEDTDKEYDGYEGMFYIASNNKTRPTVVDRGRNPVAEEDGVIYAGCVVNGTVTLWTQDNKWGKRINANLRGVQFDSEGEAFGVAPVDAEEEFDELEDSDDDDFLD